MIAAQLTAAFAVAPASRALTGRTSAPRAARPTRGMTVHAKGKGARYRNELADPYQGAKKSAEKRAKSAPKQNPADGPLNAAFAADEKTEEYFLFVRKMKTDGSNADEDDSTAPSIRADDAGVGAALGLKPDADAPGVASLGKMAPPRRRLHRRGRRSRRGGGGEEGRADRFREAETPQTSPRGGR